MNDADDCDDGGHDDADTDGGAFWRTKRRAITLTTIMTIDPKLEMLSGRRGEKFNSSDKFL